MADLTASPTILMARFLCPEVYSELSQALATHSKWTMVGPPDRKCCQVMEVPDDTQQQVEVELSTILREASRCLVESFHTSLQKLLRHYAKWVSTHGK